MSNKFQIKRTSVTGRTPNTTNSANTSFIDAGELALNMPDGKLFSSNGTALFEVGANLTSLNVSNNINLSNGTSNWISWNTSGYAPPSFTTRSVGTKLLLYPAISGIQTDYAIGINAATLWYSVPVNSDSFKFKWYGAETEIASLDGTGNLSIYGLTVNGGVTISNNANVNSLSVVGNTSIGGSLVVTGNLQVLGTSVTISTTSIGIKDNIILLNEGEEVTVTNAVGNGSVIVYTAVNAFEANNLVRVTGITPSALNTNGYVSLVAVNSTSFSISNTASNTYSSGGLASAKVGSNPDVGIVANYYDGGYAHSGIFRDASDTRWKVFDSYTPEPDASIYIDTTNTSFHLADFQSNTLYAVGGVLTSSLTVNSFFIANSTTVTVNNLSTTGTLSLTANGSLGSNGKFLASNGTIAYWQESTGLAVYDESNTLLTTVSAVIATNIDDLADVDTSTVAPANNDVLVWDAASLVWKPSSTPAVAATAYTNAVAQATTLAGTAYTNATAFAANASNISTGTLANARLASTIDVVTGLNVGTGVNLTTSSISVGNSTVNTQITAGNIALNGSTLTIGSGLNNTTITGTGLSVSGALTTGNVSIVGTANVSANLTANNVRLNGSMVIDGNLTVTGTSVTLNVASLSVEDNMIYLNGGSQVTNPDLGIAGNYNDGSYKHAGLFRDATDGRWKFFHEYTPEPDASAFIDTANASFTLANVQAHTFIGAGSFTTVNTSGTTASGNTTITGFANISNIAYANSFVATGSSPPDSSLISYAAYSGGVWINSPTGTTGYLATNGSGKLSWTSAGASVFGALAAGNTTITGFANVSSTLRTGNTTVVGQALIGDGINGITVKSGSANTHYNWKISNQDVIDGGFEIARSTSAGGSTFNNPSFVINANGSVGIGTTSPSSYQLGGKFVVAGSTSGFYFNESDNRLILDGAGTNRDLSFYLRYSNTATIASDSNLIFKTGSTPTERMRIDSNGAVYMYQQGAAGYGALNLVNADAFIRLNSTGGTTDKMKWDIRAISSTGSEALEFRTINDASNVFSTKLWIAHGGNVGIGTTSPSAKLELKLASDGDFLIGRYSSGTAKLVYAYQSGSDGFLELRTGNDDIVTKLSGYTGTPAYMMCNLGLGNTSPTAKLHVQGDAYVSGTITEASSITLKENVAPITNALDIVSQLQGCVYDRKDGTSFNEPGLIAEDVDPVLSNIIMYDDEGKPMGVKYTKLIPYLIESIKQLNQQIKDLTGKE